jgi:hypothetical protein
MLETELSTSVAQTETKFHGYMPFSKTFGLTEIRSTALRVAQHHTFEIADVRPGARLNACIIRKTKHHQLLSSYFCFTQRTIDMIIF